MAICLNELKLPLDADESSLENYAARALCIPPNAIQALKVKRISLDARKKRDIALNYTLEITLSPKDEEYVLAKGRASITRVKDDGAKREICIGTQTLNKPIVIVGLGPAGLFAAYTLALHGYKPIVIERGKRVEERAKDVAAYWASGILNPESNALFGEGGAGTFSDGKLTTRIKDVRAMEVMQTLVRFGAPGEIAVMAKPHVGTDKLKTTVAAMRQEILNLGGEIRFETQLDALQSRDGTLAGIVVENAKGTETIQCSTCILAVGHSASDTYRMLHGAGLEMLPKPYAVGLRIEHPREIIDRGQYGDFFAHPRIGAAEYQLSTRHGERGVYTFCMCPGGVVVASASGKEQVVVNGMSDYARNGENSNSAIVVQVSEKDFPPGPLGGLIYRETLEGAAYRIGGMDACAPAVRAGDFINGRISGGFGAVKPSYRPGVKAVDLRAVLPDYISAGIAAAIPDFGRKLRGFNTYDAVLTAVESRTSAPLRILRNEDGQATRLKGLYPTGEGAGYAGGIVSAAVDGMRAAEAIMAQYRAD